MSDKFGNGAPAVKVWITKAMQRAMKRAKPKVNWSAFIRAAIMRKLRAITKD